MGLTDTFLCLLTAMFLTMLLLGCQPIDNCNYDIFNGYSEECYKN